MDGDYLTIPLILPHSSGLYPTVPPAALSLPRWPTGWVEQTRRDRDEARSAAAAAAAAQRGGDHRHAAAVADLRTASFPLQTVSLYPLREQSNSG